MVVCMRRNVNFEFLDREGFTTVQKIKKLGWDFLCSLDVLTYPNLVRDFYGKIKVQVRSVVSEVKDVYVEIDIESLGHIVHMTKINMNT